MEIKFRIYDYQNEEMIYGVGITPESDTYIPYRMTGSGERFEDFNYYPESVLMQFAGVKDKEGLEIYEGDIVDSWAGSDMIGGYLREVVQAEGEPKLEFNPSSGNILCKKNEYLFEIIGNIFENPELQRGE